MDDSTRWDLIHQKTRKETEQNSKYSIEKEVLFPRNSMVLELGAGRGMDALFFLKKGHSVIAFDISPLALKILTQAAEKENLSKKLATRVVDFGLHKLPVKDSSVDIVYSRISLNYFGGNQTSKILKDIYRVLKPGGQAFVSLKSPDDSLEMEYLERNSTLYEPNVFIEGGMLRSRFTKEQVVEILKKAGIVYFKVENAKEDISSLGEGHKSELFITDITINKA